MDLTEEQEKEPNFNTELQHHPEAKTYLSRRHSTGQEGLVERKGSKRNKRKDALPPEPRYDKTAVKRANALFRQGKYDECWAACLWGLYDALLPRLLQMDLLRMMAKLKISKAQEFYDLALQMWDEIDDRSTRLRAFRVQCVREKEELMAAKERDLPDLVSHGKEENEDSTSDDLDEDSIEFSNAQLDEMAAACIARLAARDTRIEKMKQALADLEKIDASQSEVMAASLDNSQHGATEGDTTGEELSETGKTADMTFEDKTLDEIFEELQLRDEDDKALEEIVQRRKDTEEEALLHEKEQSRADSMDAGEPNTTLA